MIAGIQEKTGYSIRRICSTLELPRSSYYHAASPTARELDDRELGDQIEEIFWEHRRRYGYRRIHQELLDRGARCCPDRVRRLMKERSLRAIQPKTFVPKTSDGRADKPSENLLAGRALPERPNQVFAGDITHIRTENGWLYLAVIIDLCSRKILGWALADHMRAELVTDALLQALQSRAKVPGRIFHSDRGSQYGSKTFRALLEKAGMRQSMSARANPYQNAWTESMIGTLKAEMVRSQAFQDEQEARTELFDYLDSYYNTKRKHSSLGYRTPKQHEEATLTSTENCVDVPRERSA